MVLAVATIMKRGFMEWTETEREDMFTNIKELWDMNNEQAVRKIYDCHSGRWQSSELISCQPVLASALSNAYLDQFSDMKARAVGLNWEFHHKCKVWFEVSCPHEASGQSVLRRLIQLTHYITATYAATAVSTLTTNPSSSMPW